MVAAYRPTWNQAFIPRNEDIIAEHLHKICREYRGRPFEGIF
jgi:hypothetical protein